MHYRRITQSYEQSLSLNHPRTLGSILTLASLLKERGNFEEAETFYHKALDGLIQVLPHDHRRGAN